MAFRDTAGRAGLLAEHCPHRGASLFLGRNEDGGIRCSYHGWKFDIAGRGLECPNAPELAGTEDARQLAYPCQEAGGIVWAYLGPPEARPPLPDLGYLAADDDSRYAMKRWQDCHWLQALEVDIDSSHVAWLHREELLASPGDPKTRIILDQTAPAFEVAERDYGLLIGASRPDGDADYWRVNQWLMPWYTFIPAESDDEVLGVHAWVPVDDDHCWVWGLSWHPRRALTSAELDDWRAGRGGRFPELLPGGYYPRRNVGQPVGDRPVGAALRAALDGDRGKPGAGRRDHGQHGHGLRSQPGAAGRDRSRRHRHPAAAAGLRPGRRGGRRAAGSGGRQLRRRPRLGAPAPRRRLGRRDRRRHQHPRRNGTAGPGVNPAEHLAVPYVVTMEAVPGPDGRWVCRAAHPELPGVAAEHPLAIVALEQLEAQRIEYILGQLERGAAVPVPRPPLAYRVSEFEALNRT